MGDRAWLSIDGSLGEGGGQILRTCLALSLCLQRPFHMEPIRPRRSKPGIRHQHLAAVSAAAEVGRAHTRGAALDSSELYFEPGGVAPGDYRLDIGSAGSTSLVLQTVLPALLTAPGPSRIELIGGTHNPGAPTFEFLQQAFVPLVNQMGPTVGIHLKRAGFAPAGGGRVVVEIEPVPSLRPLWLLERGALQSVQAVAMLAHLPEHIARRELAVLAEELELPGAALQTRIVEADGQGNALVVALACEALTEIIVGFGRRGLRAEAVAAWVARGARQYLASGAPVGEHLADQLLLPLALAGEGGYVATTPTGHTTTNISVVSYFTGLSIDLRPLSRQRWYIGTGPLPATDPTAHG